MTVGSSVRVRRVAWLVAVWLNGLFAAHAGEPILLPLWPGGPPSGAASELVEEVETKTKAEGSDAAGDRLIKGVRDATLTVYLPEQGPPRATVVICPGGGFFLLAIDKEGVEVAEWLNAQGIAAAVLKYRLPDPEHGVFVKDSGMPDVVRAIRTVRANAGQWGIDPAKIGVAGFSAGGFLTAYAATHFDEGDPQAIDPIERVSSRPDFATPIYPVVDIELTGRLSQAITQRMFGPEGEQLWPRYDPIAAVDQQTPPMCLIHTADDPVSAQHSLKLFTALQEHQVPVELHVFAHGGHGYGMREIAGPVGHWRDRWLAWLESEIIAKPPATESTR
jgi:acetyl esterase/lipase